MVNALQSSSGVGEGPGAAMPPLLSEDLSASLIAFVRRMGRFYFLLSDCWENGTGMWSIDRPGVWP